MKRTRINISLRAFLLIMSAILIVVPAAALGIYNALETIRNARSVQRAELIDQIELINSRIKMTKSFTNDFVQKELDLMESKFREEGGLFLHDEIVTVPRINGTRQSTLVKKLTLNNGDYEYLEEVLNELTRDTGAYYTVFQLFNMGIIRIATSIKNEEGESARGTYIGTGSPVYSAVVDGETYHGRALILDSWYSTIYKPVFSDSGEMKYVLFAGRPESQYFEDFFSELSDKLIGNEGYYYIVDSSGNYILPPRNGVPEGDDGSEIIISGEYGPEVSLVEYEKNGRGKIDAYVYNEELDWILAASDYADRATASISDSRRIQIIIILASILVGMAVSLVLTNILYKSFVSLQKDIGKIAGGDLTVNEEAGSFFTELNRLQDVLRTDLVPTLTGLIGQIDEKSDHIGMMSEIIGFNIDQSLKSIEVVKSTSDAVEKESDKLNDLMSKSERSAESIVSSVAELKDMMSDQSSSVEQISASIEESGASLRNVSRVAKDKLENVRALEVQGETGKKYVKDTNEIISRISEDIEMLFGINEIINEITEQSKLLSMNAAIEAAHAGQQGRGFAIVAGEMRGLASNTAENGMRISETLREILDRIKAAGEQSRETISIIDGISTDISLFSDAFQEISDSTEEVSAGTSQILGAANMLSELSGKTLANSNSIGDSIVQLSEAVRLTSESSESNRDASVSLIGAVDEVVASQDEMKKLGYLNAAMGTELSESLEIFRYEKDGARKSSVVEMIRAHQLWVEKAEAHFSGEVRMNQDELGDHHSCDLGRWLDNQLDGELSGKPGFRELERIHEDMHDSIRAIAGTEYNSSGEEVLKLKNLSHKVIQQLLALIEK